LTRKWTLTDACGNTATYTQIINVDDKTGPVFTHPPAPLIEVDCVSEIPEAPYQSVKTIVIIWPLFLQFH
jgi:hypothetical protein